MTSPFALSGRTFLVTGGTRGIGRAVSLQLARSGATVLANYVRGHAAAAEVASAAAAEGLPVHLCRADLTNPQALDRIEEALAALPPLHGLVHCAATGVHRPFAELALRHYDWTFALNVRAFFALVSRLLPRFVAPASIVAVSSQGALRAVPYYSAVGASKGALEALARHRAWLEAEEERDARARARREQELMDVLEEEVARRVRVGLEAERSDGRGGLIEAVRDGTMDPYTDALRILDDASAVERLTRR